MTSPFQRHEEITFEEYLTFRSGSRTETATFRR